MRTKILAFTIAAALTFAALLPLATAGVAQARSAPRPASADWCFAC